MILIAVTGMRISEALALTWDAVDWIKGKIRIRRKWNGKSYGPPKSLMSRKPVEMTKGLATVLEVWRQETTYAKDGDLLFPIPERGQAATAWQHDRGGLHPSCGYRCRSVGGKGRKVYYDGETVTVSDSIPFATGWRLGWLSRAPTRRSSSACCATAART